ncbi:MAG TPA: hypothetical protein VF756_20365 [Thermoanaerobaculia bacterium]
MGFKLSVDFIGLLHYVQNDGERDVQLCAVLPMADNHNGLIKGESGTTLRRQGDTVTQTVNFNGKRVVFLLEKEASSQTSAELNFSAAVLDGEVKGAVPIQDLIGDLADQNPRIVMEDTTEQDGVRAQILIEEGEFSLPGADNPARLELRRTPQSPAESLKLSPTVRMEVDGLLSAAIVVLPLGTLDLAKADIYSVEPGNQDAEVEISHLCPFALAALDRPIPEEDEDFRFHYTLLRQEQPQSSGSGPSRMEDPIDLASLPVPRIAELPRIPFGLFRAEHASLGNRLFSAASGSGLLPQSGQQAHRPYGLSGTTCNCASCNGVPRPYNLDTFSQRNLGPVLGRQ